MDVSCLYSALAATFTWGTQLGFVLFVKLLAEILRPDIVDVANRVSVTVPQNLSSSYDFIIIGGGSAGAVLANRLSENEEWSVLLLEAGTDETVISDIPALARNLQKTDKDWEFKTEPSLTSCLGFNNHQCVQPRGRGLGGTSTINFMMYIRGNKETYNNWQNLGNPGWGYDSVLPYFKKSENMTIPSLRNSSYHGTDGYLTVESLKFRTPVSEYFLQAGQDLGYDIVDVNGATQKGFMGTHGTLRNGLRCSVAKAFLRPASHRPNLVVSTNSLVEKILIDESTKTATGVQFRQGNNKYVVRAKKEVILSAGALKSPQILMLSGVGPKSHLENMGIKVIHDSQGVGRNLQDHVAMGGLTFLIDLPAPAGVSKSSIELFMNQTSGPLNGLGSTESVAFVTTKYANSIPDIELVFASGGDNAGAGFSAKYYRGMKDEFYRSLYDNIQTNVTYSVSVILLQPKSTGYVELKDLDANHPPAIVTNYFSNPHDLDVLIEGAKIVYNISQTPTMQKYNARINTNVIPQCAKFKFLSDDYLRCHARYYTLTAYHPTSTCKMGPKNDTKAVVDPRLRVYGISNLRVVDSSIMPMVTTGNTNAPTIMIAEKTADLIKEDYDCSQTDTQTN